METIVIAIAALACPLGMGLMMLFMAKGMMGGRNKDEPASEEVDRLRAEQQRLASDVERLERERGANAEVPAR